MRKILIGAAVVSMLATAAAAETESTTSSTMIVEQSALTKQSELAFGTIVKPTTGDALVSISNTGTRTVGAGAVGLPSTTSAATFLVTGLADSSVDVIVDDTVTMNGPDDATLVVDLTDPGATATLDELGSATFGIGGSFTVSDDTTAGAYTGNFNVTVGYD